MGKRLLSVLLVLLTGSAAVAQDITRFKVLVMGPKTFSSAGILLTHARDNHFGTIIGTTSTF